MKKVKAIVEMPAGSSYKYEVDGFGGLRLDRPLSVPVPHNYGFLKNTLSQDGDALDCFLLSEHPILALAEADAWIVGVLKCTDNGVPDDKVICVLVGEELQFDSQGVSFAIEFIAQYLSTYKEGFVINAYENAGQAIQTYELSRVWGNPQD